MSFYLPLILWAISAPLYLTAPQYKPPVNLEECVLWNGF